MLDQSQSHLDSKNRQLNNRNRNLKKYVHSWVSSIRDNAYIVKKKEKNHIDFGFRKLCSNTMICVFHQSNIVDERVCIYDWFSVLKFFNQTVYLWFFVQCSFCIDWRHHLMTCSIFDLYNHAYKRLCLIEGNRSCMWSFGQCIRNHKTIEILCKIENQLDRIAVGWKSIVLVLYVRFVTVLYVHICSSVRPTYMH